MEPYDVSFAVIRSDENWTDTVQKIATAINVQFTESSQSLPFVPFSGFQRLLNEDKIFLFGPSGCGKSRTIIELLRNKRATYDRIVVINPSNPAGFDSGRENIAVLAQKFGRNDIVIWDNFPDGMVKRDLESAFGALEIINSMSMQNMYIALKPKYLEMYRGLTIGIPDICNHEIICDLATMKSMLKSYGAVEQYQGVFENCVSPNIDRISRILWQKQPLSITIIDYYKSMVYTSESQAPDPSRALQIAQDWLPVYDYFDRQFEVMKNIPGREPDVEFLYTLRFCYEAGFERTPASIETLQKGIFGSSPPPEPTRRMGTWIYLSGQNIGMHDSAKNAVNLTDYAKMKISLFLANHFCEIVPKGDGELHALGMFLGRNMQFIANASEARMVPSQVYEFMKKKAVFERAFGRGVGENFELLDETSQGSILQYVDTEIEFGVGLADSLGERLVELDDNNRKLILEKIYHGMLLARYFGQSVGRLYSRLPEELRQLVMSHAARNPQFADGLGMGLGYAYSTIDPALQNDIMTRAQKSFEISRGLGFGFGLTFALQDEKTRVELAALADRNSELDTGFGMGMAVSYSALPEQLRRFVLDRAGRDCEFAFGAAIYAAYFYKESCPQELFELLHTNTEIAYGLGLGYGTTLFYLSEKFQSELDSMLKTNVKLDDGMGSGIGLVLKHLPAEIQDKLIAKASTNNAFAIGLGYGLGYTWHYIGDSLRARAKTLANTNNGFAQGLGYGLGCHLDYLKPDFIDDVVSLADTNSEMDRGFGAGAAWAWPYYSDEARRITAERMESRAEFSRGAGFGVARVARHFIAGQKADILDRTSNDPAFAEGFGEGTGNYLWSIYDEQHKREFLDKASGAAEISRGLGAGIGFLHSYFKSEMGTFRDPETKRGLGIGVGSAYKYLQEDVRAEAFRMAEGDIEFATGFGQGIGTVYNYLENQEKSMTISYIGENGFTKGLGIGIGSIFPYLGEGSRIEILGYAARIAQLSLGLGAGIGMHIQYLNNDLASDMFESAKNNSHLAIGLGEGCGGIFPRLSRSTKDWLSSHVNIDGFAFGFGVGMGRIRKYIERHILEEAASFAGNNKFYEGLAIGLGSTAAHLPKEILVEVARSDNTRDFGFALGHVFPLLDAGRRNEVMEIMKDDEEFLAGLGEGAGHYLPVAGGQTLEEIMAYSSSPGLVTGTARGVIESFNHLDLAETIGMLEYADSHPEYGRVLGEGLAERFVSLGADKQSHILNALQKDSDFARAFAKAIPKNLAYMSAQSRDRLRSLIAELPHLAALVKEEYES